MQFQTATNVETAEVVFRAVRSSITVTQTATDRLAAGEPVILATETASNNGHFVARPVTSTNVIVNNLYVGNVHQTIEHDSIGLVQVYGIDGDCAYSGTTTQAPGMILRPESLRGMISVAPLYGSAATDTAVHAAVAGVGGFAYVVAQLNVATTQSAPVACKAFIRAL